MLMLPAIAAFATLVSSADAWTELAAGNYLQSGSISSTLRWQSSGYLASGGCSSSWGIKVSYRDLLLFRSAERDHELTATGLASLVNLKKCYSLRLGGVGTNLQSTTAADYNSKLRTFSAAAPSTQAGWENLAAADDDNLEAYFNAFPAAYSSNFADVKLMARQVVQNCTGGGGGNGTEPPPPPSPRQRIEFLSWPGAAAGQTWKYTWKSRYGTTSTGVRLAPSLLSLLGTRSLCSSRLLVFCSVLTIMLTFRQPTGQLQPHLADPSSRCLRRVSLSTFVSAK